MTGTDGETGEGEVGIGSGEAPGGGDSETDQGPWYEQTWSYVSAGVLGVIVIIVIIVVAVSSGDDPKDPADSTTTTGSTTTVPQNEADCREGDEGACAELDGDVLNELCQDDVEVACAEVFTRLGESSTPDTAAPSLSTSDQCRNGDSSACGQLSSSEVVSLCSQGVEAACSAGGATDEAQTPDELDDQTVIDLCPDPAANPDDGVCQERNARGI